jgi:hypothetical protein
MRLGFKQFIMTKAVDAREETIVAQVAFHAPNGKEIVTQMMTVKRV